MGWYVVGNRFERGSCSRLTPCSVHFVSILGSMWGSNLESILKRFDNDNGYPTSSPGNSPGWTMGGAISTTLPPLHSPLCKKYKSLHNGPLVTTSQALPVIRPQVLPARWRVLSPSEPPPLFSYRVSIQLPASDERFPSPLT